MPTELITIQRYRSEYQSGVVQLILPIQNEEFGIAITAAQQPDLSDISHFYQQGKGDFWLAQIGERVVGCIGLKDIGQQQTALRKMFVAAPYRGREWGVASALLNTLMMHARHQGWTIFSWVPPRSFSRRIVFTRKTVLVRFR